MTFNKYINLDSKNYQEIIDYYLNYLDEFSSNDYPFEKSLQLKGTATKFVNCIYDTTYIKKEEQNKYFELIDRFNERLSFYRRRQNRSRLSKILLPTIGIIMVREEFEKIYSKTLDIINEANKTLEYKSRNLEINDFYKPDNSNKAKIKKLIVEAIELIKEDDSLTKKSKKQLIDYLNKVLSNLDYEHTNWTNVIGKIKETIIVLGALGSVIGGMSPLFQAKEKLEETTIVIEKTSINLNYKVINETFNNNQIMSINSNNTSILQLEEKNDEKKRK